MTGRNAARGRPGSTLLAGVLVAVLAVGPAGCGKPDPDDGTPGSTPQPVSTSAEPPSEPVVTSAAGASTVVVVVTASESATAALALLDTLPVQGRAPQTGDSRAQFGQAWSDDVSVDGGHNGCDTRNDVLRRDLTDTQIKPGTGGCVVLSGTLADPYTGSEIEFRRGAATSDDVQIDHVVALSDAWQSGAQQLTAEQRRDFGNDPSNLQATIGWVNQQKGPATRRPGCRRTRATAARMSRGRSRSRRSTGCGSSPRKRTQWQGF